MRFNLRLVFATLICSCFLNTLALAKTQFEFEEDHTLPIVYLNIALDVGSAQDPSKKLGLANLSSEMLLRGTQYHNKNEFFKKLDLIGGQLDVDVRNEGTVFRAAVLSENLNEFLTLIDEALTKPKFREEELNKLKKEVEGLILEEKGNDRSLVVYHFYRFFYGDHSYGNPDKGTLHSIKKITHTDILRFYENHFGSKTMAFFGTGDAKQEQIKTWFHNLTLKLDALHPKASPVDPIAMPEIKNGRRILLVDKPNTSQTQVLIGGPGVRPEVDGFFAAQLANHSFGGPTFQARLMQEIRVKRGWTYGAYNSFKFGKKPKHFAMYIFPKTADTPPAIKLTLQLFEEFVKNGVTQQEYQFSKNALVNNAPFQYDTAKKRLENSTSEYLMNFPTDYFKNYAGHIEDVSYDSLKDAVQKIFSTENLTITVVGDAKKLKKELSTLKGFSAPIVKNYLKD